MATWVKPNKTEIELNDLPATIEKARSLKWKRKGEKVAPKKEETKPKAE